MKAFSRRSLLSCSVAMIPPALVACSTTGTAPVIPTTVDPVILADAQSAVLEVKTIVTLVEQNDPTAITPAVAANIATSLAAAQALVSGLSSTTPAVAGATTLQQVLGDVNLILNAVQPVLAVVAVADPALAPAVTAYDLALPLLPGLEAWITSVVGTVVANTTAPAAARAPLRPFKTGYTLSAARAEIAKQKAAGAI
jgi:hypothetical protein